MKAKRAIKANWEVVSELENSEMHSKELEDAIDSGNVEESRKDGNPEKEFRKLRCCTPATAFL